MSSPLQIATLLLALGGVLFVSGQDNSGCLEHIDNFNQTVFGDHVYYISTETKHWTDAKTACEKLEGKLAVLDNKTALEHVREVLKANTRGGENMFWVGLQWNYTAKVYQWLSGQSHVHKNNPSWQGPDDDFFGLYVAMVPPGFLFNNNADNNDFYYVCEKERTVWPIGRHDGKDFYVANKMMDWSAGRRFCQACKDARLAEIRDEGTQRFFTDALIDPRPPVYWMGLQGNRSGSDSVTWMWSTGDEIICNLSPAPFPCQRISNAFLGDFGWKCIHIATSTSQWVGDNCTTERGVLCEQVQDILRPESSTNAEVASSETDVDECYLNPCQNGEICRDGVNSYTCFCVLGFTGINCTTNINDCSPDPCQNGGTCQDGVNSYNCSCAPGFEGTNCSQNKNSQEVAAALKTGLGAGIGLGIALLLALVTFGLYRCRRRHPPQSESSGTSNEMSSITPSANANIPRSASRDGDGDNYQPLDASTMDRIPSNPYDQLGGYETNRPAPGDYEQV